MSPNINIGSKPYTYNGDNSSITLIVEGEVLVSVVKNISVACSRYNGSNGCMISWSGNKITIKPQCVDSGKSGNGTVVYAYK